MINLINKMQSQTCTWLQQMQQCLRARLFASFISIHYLFIKNHMLELDLQW